MQPLVAALAERLRQRHLELVGRAYSTIGLPKLATLLGCTEAEAEQAAATAGWEAGEGGLVEVKAPSSAGVAAAASGSAADRAVQRLTAYVVHLEA